VANVLIPVPPQHPEDVNQVLTLGQVLAESGFFADARGAAQAVTKILAGRELGFGPITSMMSVYIIKGRISFSAILLAAAIRRSRVYDYKIERLDDQGCVITFVRDGEVIGTSTFTMEDAKRAGLASGDNWKHYPRNMCFAWAISNGAKWFCPDLFAGTPVYTPEELGAEVDGETGEVTTIPTEVQPARVVIITPEQHEELQRLIRRKGVNLFKVMDHYQVQSLLDLTPEQCVELTGILHSRPDVTESQVSNS
jgi:hypothetical protein